MASKNPDASEAAFKKTQKQEEGEETSNMPEGGETSNMPEGGETSNMPRRNLPAVLLYDVGAEQYGLLGLPAGDGIQTMNNIRREDGWLIGSFEGGWLILYSLLFPSEYLFFPCEIQISLVNPFSGATVNLPLEQCTVRECSIMNLVTSSSVPPDSRDFVTVAYFTNSEKKWLAFCTIQDHSWTHIDIQEHLTESNPKLILALDDKCKLLYCLNVNRICATANFITVSDLNDRSNITKNAILINDENPVLGYGSMLESLAGLGTRFQEGQKSVFLAVDCSSGELFLILQVNDIVFLQNGYPLDLLPVQKFRVFLLDNVGPRWKELDDIGDRVIFLSTSGSSVISNVNMATQSDEVKIRGNCLYYALHCEHPDERLVKRDAGIFSLKDKTIHRISLPSSARRPISTLWFTPPPEELLV